MTTPINIYIILSSSFLLLHSINGNQEQCIGEGGSCDYDNDCCGDRNIRCVGAWEPTKKKGTCKKTCDLVGAHCTSDRSCCNYCTNNKCSYVSDMPG
ncbi:unnamed protein product [Meloidogyne enterolobii]|uniref:Uncharacterized protein n=1 Tax=Meloidogyne enterolobii TaxID=390850 RepID=A0ACB0YJL6_MELEN